MTLLILVIVEVGFGPWFKIWIIKVKLIAMNQWL